MSNNFGYDEAFWTIADRCEDVHSAYIHGMTRWGKYQHADLKHGPRPKGDFSNLRTRMRKEGLVTVSQFLSWESFASCAEACLVTHKDKFMAVRNTARKAGNAGKKANHKAFQVAEVVTMNRPVAQGMRLVEDAVNPRGHRFERVPEITKALCLFSYNQIDDMWYLITAYGVMGETKTRSIPKKREKASKVVKVKPTVAETIPKNSRKSLRQELEERMAKIQQKGQQNSIRSQTKNVPRWKSVFSAEREKLHGYFGMSEMSYQWMYWAFKIMHEAKIPWPKPEDEVDGLIPVDDYINSWEIILEKIGDAGVSIYILPYLYHYLGQSLTGTVEEGIRATAVLPTGEPSEAAIRGTVLAAA